MKRSKGMTVKEKERRMTMRGRAILTLPHPPKARRRWSDLRAKPPRNPS